MSVLSIGAFGSTLLQRTAHSFEFTGIRDDTTARLFVAHNTKA
ncbi:hypothetical protein [Azospirillum argentinense]